MLCNNTQGHVALLLNKFNVTDIDNEEPKERVRSIELDPREDNSLMSHVIGYPSVDYLWECKGCSDFTANNSDVLNLTKGWAADGDIHTITCNNTVDDCKFTLFYITSYLLHLYILCSVVMLMI